MQPLTDSNFVSGAKRVRKVYYALNVQVNIKLNTPPEKNLYNKLILSPSLSLSLLLIIFVIPLRWIWIENWVAKWPESLHDSRVFKESAFAVA